MSDHREIPTPEYSFRTQKLVNAYKQAVEDILRELEHIDVTDISRANSQAALAHVAEILKELDSDMKDWVSENIPVAALDGVAGAVYALGVVDTMEEAISIAKFNRLNKELVKYAVADTQKDLLAVTQNIDRKVRGTVRRVVAESMRANLSSGINGRRTISRDIVKGLRDQLGAAADGAVIDAKGRRWKTEVYVDTVVQTKMMNVHRDSTVNEALSREVLYGQISRHGATDACRNYEGMIVKLVDDAPGNYRTLSSLQGIRDIFHPRCRHIVSPIRNPEDA